MVAVAEPVRDLVCQLTDQGFDVHFIARAAGISVHQASDIQHSYKKALITISDDPARQMDRVRQYAFVAALDLQVKQVYEQLQGAQADLQGMKGAGEKAPVMQKQEELILAIRKQLVELLDRKSAAASQDAVFFSLR